MNKSNLFFLLNRRTLLLLFSISVFGGFFLFSPDSFAGQFVNCTLLPPYGTGCPSNGDSCNGGHVPNGCIYAPGCDCDTSADNSTWSSQPGGGFYCDPSTIAGYCPTGSCNSSTQTNFGCGSCTDSNGIHTGQFSDCACCGPNCSSCGGGGGGGGGGGIPTAGVCGTANGWYSESATAFRGGSMTLWNGSIYWYGLCAAGAPVPSAFISFPSPGNQTTWRCENPGYSFYGVNCRAQHQLNGACNPTYNGGTFASIPSSGLCTKGNQAGPVDHGTYWSWTCNGVFSGGTANCSATRASVPTLSFWADATIIPNNTGTTLHWLSTNATSCTASGSWSGAKGYASGTTYNESTGNLLTNVYNYTLQCSGPGGSSPTRTVIITVQTPTPASGNITGNGCTIPSGASTCNGTFTWNISNPSGVANVYNSTTNTTYSFASSGTSVDYPITQGANIVRARDGIATLDLTTVTGTCVTGTSWDSSKCAPDQTLSVNVSADPVSGNAPLSSLITATVGGTATGTVNYRFYCDGSSLTQTYSNQPATTLSHTCSYASAGTYSPKVEVDRGTAPMATGTATVNVNALATFSCSGSIIGGAVMWDSEENTGLSGPASWAYADPDTSTKCQFHCVAGVTEWNPATSSCVPIDPCVPTPCTPSENANHCSGSYTLSGCTCTGTKDCREFWREVRP